MEFTGERFIPGQTGQIELEHLNRYYFVVNQMELTGKTVLDLASGEGYGTDLLAQYSKHVIGVDISNETIEHAKSKYKMDNLKFLVGDACRIPLSDHSVDVVVSFETIEHHNKHEEMLYEIKRVLKPSGILVMSSPDKYWYSDMPKYVNEFHIKELYFDEFKNLIKRHFKKTFFYNQRIFIGSIITLDEGISEYKDPLVVEKDGTKHKFDPLYNLTIASDNTNLLPSYQQVLLKESDSLITQRDILDAQDLIRRRRAYVIGNLILTPFRIIKRLIS